MTETPEKLPSRGPLPGAEQASVDLIEAVLRELTDAQSHIASTQYTVARLQQSIRIHHGVVDFLLQMLDRLRQASLALMTERDALRQQLERQAHANAELDAVRARLDDTRARLDETELARAETNRRLAEAQHQRTAAVRLRDEAIRLRNEAIGQLLRCRTRMAELECSILAARSMRALRQGDDDAEPVMGEASQWLLPAALRGVDEVLEREASNLEELRNSIPDATPVEGAETTQPTAGRPARAADAATGHRAAVIAATISVAHNGEIAPEVTVEHWRKQTGEYVYEGEVLVDVASNAADIQIPAVISGFLREIHVAEGATVAAGSVLGVIEEVPQPEQAERSRQQITRKSPGAASYPRPRQPEVNHSAHAVTMPWVGESVVEGTVIQWYSKEGDYVDSGQRLVDIDYAKVDLEVPAPYSGYLRQILVDKDVSVPIGTVLGYIGE